MPRPLGWRSLTGGVLVFLSLAAIALAVLVYARVGALRGDTIDLYVVGRDTRGIVTGSEVWLAGRRIGVVDDITFRPASSPVTERLVLHTRILTDAADQVRRDARAEIRAGATIIGAPVISIQPGTTASPPIADGDTIVVEPRQDFELALSKAADAAAELPAIAADLRTTAGHVRTMRRETADLFTDDGPARETMRRFGELRARMAGGGARGSAGLFLANRDSIAVRARGIMSSVDTVRTLLASRTAAIGRFRRDTTLAAAVGALQRDLDAVRRLASSPVGTVGRVRTDSALIRGMDSVRAELGVLMADIKAHPFRYLVIFHP